MVRHLGRMTENRMNEKKVQAVKEIVNKGNLVTANQLEQELKLSSRQIAQLLKRINEVERTGKKYNRYQYRVKPETKEVIYGNFKFVINGEDINE